jgi:hypothetical protein
VEGDSEISSAVVILICRTARYDERVCLRGELSNDIYRASLPSSSKVGFIRY